MNVIHKLHLTTLTLKFVTHSPFCSTLPLLHFLQLSPDLRLTLGGDWPTNVPNGLVGLVENDVAQNSDSPNGPSSGVVVECRL